MNRRTGQIASGACVWLSAAAAVHGGPSPAVNVDSVNKMAWFENAGWLNARDAGGAWGISAARTHLRGWAWGENVGWVSMGSGPVDGVAYGNTAAPDVGVNIDGVTGELTGWAWGENIGWVRFGLPTLLPTERARLERSTGGVVRARGYAWGENVGWLSFEGTQEGAFVAFAGGVVACGPADVADTSGAATVPWGGDGQVDNGDFSAFFTAFFAADCPGCGEAPGAACSVADVADTAGAAGADGCVDNGDFSLFFTAFFAGCP